GGFGVVFEGRGAGGERVAVKVLRESLAATSARERFESEARILQSLKHPGIATFIAAGTREGLPYLVQSYVDGRDVRSHCEQTGADTSARVRLVCEALEAIAHAHAKGVIHRDIKPANVLVTADGRVSVIDFGIARQSEQPGVTRTGQRVGTTAYMSPEQLEASGDVAAAADVYAMGVVLYELLTGHLPYDPVLFASEPERAIRVGGVLPMSRWTQAVPSAIEDVVRRALRKQPGDRYADASGFAAALRAALAGMRPENVWTKSAFAVRRFTRRYGALAAAAGIGVGLVTWLAVDRASTRRENASLAAKASSAEYIDTLQAAAYALRKMDNSGARETLKGVDEAQRGPEWRWMAAMAEPAPVVREYSESVWDVESDPDGLLLSLSNGDLTLLSRDGSVRWQSAGVGAPKAFAVLRRVDGDLIASCDTVGLYLHRKSDGVELDHPAKNTPRMARIAAYGDGAVALSPPALVFTDFRSPVTRLFEIPALHKGISLAVDQRSGLIVVATYCKKRDCDNGFLIAGKMVAGKWQQAWQTAITLNGAHELLIGTDPASGRRIVIACSLDKSVFVHDLLTGEAMA
ncbi:MAG TPA: serine/threonine-protein kinase, partial [Phycisphaerales bacterium]|nr:serine/threonine-protein kinase [Phycisphaerales bacterium]